MSKTIDNATLEKAVRAHELGPDSNLARMIASVDAARAEGRNMEFRISKEDERVYVVELKQVTANLADMEDDDGDDEDMYNADGSPKIDFAWADEE